MPRSVRLADRAVLRVSGPDARGLLQGIVTNDMERVAPARAIWAALLTPQGKYLHDFMIAQDAEGFLFDADAARLAELKKRLAMYRLRAKVTIEEQPGLAVFALWDADAAARCGLADAPGAAAPWQNGIAFVDPRLAALGARAILPADAAAAAALQSAGFAAAKPGEYERHRIALGVPDGARDLVADKSYPMENGFDALNGIDFAKGCYVGQEVTARMKHRGLVKKRLFPVAIEGDPPPPGTAVRRGAVDAGELRGAAGGIGLALLKLDQAFADDAAPLTAGDARLTPRKPAWMAE
ncbi:MAG: folate-binding protein YgfZ [Rhodospirillales bacterium]